MINFLDGIFLVSATLGILIYIYLVWNFKYWQKCGVKGPSPKPLLGNVSGVVTFSHHMIYDLHKIYREYKDKEGLVGIFIIREPRLLLLDPKLVREVLIGNFKDFSKNDIIFPVDKKVDKLIGRNPFFLHGAEWKEKRSEIIPALTTNRVKASYPVMLEVCKKMSRYLGEQFKNPPKDGIEAKNLSARYTAELVTNCIFGLEAGAFAEEHCAILEKGSKIFGSNTFMENLFIFILITFPALKNILRYRMVSKETEEFFTNLMREAVLHRERSKDDRVDFLNYLLQLRDRKNLSDLEMASNTLTFFMDGFETSSILIAHCIYMLAKHKAVQEKLRTEINEVILEHGEISFDKLMELPYLDCVMNETLRLFPPLAVMSKVCTEPHDFKDSMGKTLRIEKDVVVTLPIYTIQRDEEYYDNPNEFIPERFCEENGDVKKFKDQGVFFPFGDGPRICIGMRFGLTQSKAAIVELVKNWHMEINGRTKPDYVADPNCFLLAKEGGIWIDFTKIKKNL